MAIFTARNRFRVLGILSIFGCGDKEQPTPQDGTKRPPPDEQCLPASEVCNGQDDDCDGVVDEGVFNACGGCESLAGMPGDACDDGLHPGSCGAWICSPDLTAVVCENDNSADEVCDGRDNDCDGETDEGALNACGGCALLANVPGDPCDGSDVDLCEDDSYECEDADTVVCSSGEDNGDPCDGEDNDCDGTVDEGSNACDGACPLANLPGTACDGADSDLCTDDAYECSGLNTTVCSVGDNDLELYDGSTDEDCDGEIDEDLRRLSGTVTLSGALSFEVCELSGSAVVVVAGTLSLSCGTLFIGEFAQIYADGVGDAGLCNGGNGSGGGLTASGGGGGGGCHAASAGGGGYGQWVAVATPGAGGTNLYGSVSGLDVYAGSRGGNGGAIYCPPGAVPGTNSCGARGGGLIEIYVAEEATIAGMISVSGGDGDQRGWNICDDGAGGAGAGGTVLIDAPVLTLASSARITADGGQGGRGGSGCGPSSHGGGGGGGSGGRIKALIGEGIVDSVTYFDTAAFLGAAVSGGYFTAAGGDGGAAGGPTAEEGQPGEDGTIAEFTP
ncbi:hypothetical protein HYW17_05395 [Candidatus Uhrbacteria bacterium]|nr:hypothetical protein [Candidatus Uhrbacteria bacterium]